MWNFGGAACPAYGGECPLPPGMMHFRPRPSTYGACASIPEKSSMPTPPQAARFLAALVHLVGMSWSTSVATRKIDGFSVSNARFYVTTVVPVWSSPVDVPLWSGDDREDRCGSWSCLNLSRNFGCASQNTGLHHGWESIRRVLFTYFWWTLGGASAGALYALGVASLHWVQTGRSDIFTTMPQPLMWLGALSGALLATTVVLGRLGEPGSR